MRTIRNFILGSAASLLLAGTAQAGQSTAGEREQTRQLNLQASQQTAAAASPAGGAAAPLPESLAPVALNSLTNPPDKIATARVMDEKGTIVGAVQKVDLNQSGKPTQVEIALLGSDRIVALDSAQLSYDLSNNVVTVALDKNQLAQLPAVPLG